MGDLGASFYKNLVHIFIKFSLEYLPEMAPLRMVEDATQTSTGAVNFSFPFDQVIPFFLVLIAQLVRISLVVFVVILLIGIKLREEGNPLFNGLIPYNIF